MIKKSDMQKNIVTLLAVLINSTIMAQRDGWKGRSLIEIKDISDGKINCKCGA